MITGALRSKIDRLWLEFHSGGITNPLTVIEQITYLMFLRLLDIADWGGATVFAQTVDRVREAGLRLGLLPPWYDVDTVDDARFLTAHLKAMRAANEEVELPLTEQALRERFGS